MPTAFEVVVNLDVGNVEDRLNHVAVLAGVHNDRVEFGPPLECVNYGNHLDGLGASSEDDHHGRGRDRVV